MAFPWAACSRRGHALGSSSAVSVSHIMQQLLKGSILDSPGVHGKMKPWLDGGWAVHAWQYEQCFNVQIKVKNTHCFF